MAEDEEIDFRKLEKELALAVEADAKYQRENAAKFRAVEQRVGSYEEFKDIVAASHLKPLEKKDRLGQEKIKQSWNSLATGKSEKSQNSSSSPPSRPSLLVKTAHNFTKAWKYEMKTLEDKYSYLYSTGGTELGRIFKSEISMGLLGEFAEVLQKCFRQQDCEVIVDILLHLSTTKRFNLSVDFLSSKEKMYLQDLFTALDKLKNDNDEKVESIKFQKLQEIYRIEL